MRDVLASITLRVQPQNGRNTWGIDQRSQVDTPPLQSCRLTFRCSKRTFHNRNDWRLATITFTTVI